VSTKADYKKPGAVVPLPVRPHAVTVELHKSDVINMICGSAVPVRGGSLLNFAGNQHNEAWAWDRAKLEAMDINDLMGVYAELNWSEPAPEEAPAAVEKKLIVLA
jgi:hypothetical protein